MSLYDDASLVMIPSGYKDQKVYSAKPTDGSGDLTFSRGSDIEATRVNSQGLIEKAKVNLLLQSNQFDTTWAAVNTTLTSGQGGYDGSSDAWLLSKAASAGNIQLSVSTSGVHTFSYYAKAGSVNWTRLLILGTANASTYINLTNGAIGIGGGGFIDATATSVGGGWYRVTITHSTAITQVRIYPADDDDDTSGTSGNIYIQDAQLNYGLVAQDYVETTTAAVVTGITNDMPRLNYDPANPTCPSLLLEPSRTNLVTQSEYIGAWGATNVTVTDNNTTSPEGVVNGAKIERTAAGGYISLNTSATGTQSYSVFAKAGDLNYVRLLALGTGNPNVYFNLSSGTVGTATAATGSIEAYSNGWYRCTIVYDTTITAVRAYPTETDASTGGANGYVYIYGAQCEAGSYPTSYIPTYGTSATRTAEAANLNPSSLLGATQGSWFMELDDLTFEITGTSVPTAFIGSDVSNCLAIEGRASGQNKNIYFVKEQSGSVTTLTTKEISTTLKACFVWNGTSLKCFVDGVKAYDAGGFTQPSNWNVWSLNSTGREAQQFIKQEILFATALSDADAITLTT